MSGMSRLWSSLKGMLRRIKDFSVSIFRSLYRLIFKLMNGLLYLLKLRKRSPFSEPDALKGEDHLDQEGRVLSAQDVELKQLESKRRMFDQIMKVLLVITVIGFVYANFLKGRPEAGVKAAELVGSLGKVEVVLEGIKSQ